MRSKHLRDLMVTSCAVNAAGWCAMYYALGWWWLLALFAFYVGLGLVVLYPYPTTSGPRPGGTRRDGRTTDGRSQGGDQ